MKKLLALVLAVTMLVATGGVALAQVEPAEVNIVLPSGSTANVTKTVSIGDVGTVDIWGEISADAGLDVTLNPTVHEDVLGPTTVSFDELITVTAWGGVPLYATVTFYYGDYDTTKTIISEQIISVTEGYLDIKPGSFPNSINRNKGGVTPVALLGYEGFDVTTANVTALWFGGTTPQQPVHDLTDPDTYADHLQDVNYDGYLDLVSHYRTKDLGLIGDTACLDYGLLGDPTVYTECDSIRIVK